MYEDAANYPEDRVIVRVLAAAAVVVVMHPDLLVKTCQQLWKHTERLQSYPCSPVSKSHCIQWDIISE